MSFFQMALRTTLRPLLTSWRSWLFLLLIPLGAFGVRALFPAEEALAPVQVGVVLPQRGGEAFWELLEARGGVAVSFFPAEAEQARREVAAGRWDCALVLPDDFEERLERLDTYRLIRLLTAPGSSVYPMVREMAAACVAELISPGVAERYLLDSGLADSRSIEALRSRGTEAPPERVLISMETVDGRRLAPLVLAERGTDRLLSGLLAIVLLVYMLFTAMDLGRWLESPPARRLLPLRSALELLLPRLMGPLVLALCAGGAALRALDRPGYGLLSLLLYLLFWGAAALVFAQCRALWTTLPVLIPFVPAAGLLLSPVLLDLSLLFPALAPVIRWNPVSLYLWSCEGHREDTLALAAGTALLCGLLGVLSMMDGRRNARGRSA